MDASRKPHVLSANAIDEGTYQAQLADLQNAMSVDPTKQQRFDQLREYYGAILGSR